MFWTLAILATFSIWVTEIQGQTSNYTSMDIKPDGEWHPFSFGGVGQPPFNLIRVGIGLMNAMNSETKENKMHPIKKCYLEVTDAFCPGDRFEVIKLGKGGLAPTTILKTPIVPFNAQVAEEICDGFPAQCSNSTSNPEVAFNDDSWSSGKALLFAGNHTIIIKPLTSPYCSGAGFVRVRCTDPPHPHPHPHPTPKPEAICKFSEGGFRMVMKPTMGPVAGAVCTKLGMKLAEIDNANFVASTNTAFKCSGPLSTSWIGAWNGQTWAGQEGLGLTVSTASPGGSINVYNDGKARNVLCQEI